MKNQKGITLVALVVTIIVLLILAGVTIMFVLQGDSIFGQAKNAKTETHTANVREAVAVALAGVQTRYYVPEKSNKDFYKVENDVVTALPNPETIATKIMKAELTKAGVDATAFTLTSFAPSDDTVGIKTAEAGCTVKYNGISYTVIINTLDTAGQILKVTPVATPTASASPTGA